MLRMEFSCEKCKCVSFIITQCESDGVKVCCVSCWHEEEIKEFHGDVKDLNW
jgi:hypothetical protein